MRCSNKNLPASTCNMCAVFLSPSKPAVSLAMDIWFSWYSLYTLQSYYALHKHISLECCYPFNTITYFMGTEEAYQYFRRYRPNFSPTDRLLHFLLTDLIDALSSYTFLAVTNYSSSPDRTSSWVRCAQLGENAYFNPPHGVVTFRSVALAKASLNYFCSGFTCSTLL